MNTSPNKIHNFPSEYDIKKHVEHTVVYNIVQYTIFEVVGKVKKGITDSETLDYSVLSVWLHRFT